MGSINSLNFALFLVYAYIIMAVFEGGLEGYALSMGVYEFLNLICSASFYFYSVHPEAKSMELSIFTNFTWYFKECLKATLASCYNWIAGEFVLIIITMTKDDYQVAAYSILNEITNVVVMVIMGFMSHPKAEINKVLSQKLYKLAMEMYYRFLWIITGAGAVIALIIMTTISYIYVTSAENRFTLILF